MKTFNKAYSLNQVYVIVRSVVHELEGIKPYGGIVTNSLERSPRLRFVDKQLAGRLVVVD